MKSPLIDNEFFKTHPEKVLGEFSISDYMNKIIVKGDRAQVEEYFSSNLPEKEDEADSIASDPVANKIASEKALMSITDQFKQRIAKQSTATATDIKPNPSMKSLVNKRMKFPKNPNKPQHGKYGLGDKKAKAERGKPLFKVEDYIEYIAGDLEKETWYGKVEKVIDLDTEYAYRIDAYREHFTGMNGDIHTVDYDGAKTNEKYEISLHPSDGLLYEVLKMAYAKNKKNEVGSMQDIEKQQKSLIKKLVLIAQKNPEYFSDITHYIDEYPDEEQVDISIKANAKSVSEEISKEYFSAKKNNENEGLIAAVDEVIEKFENSESGKKNISPVLDKVESPVIHAIEKVEGFRVLSIEDNIKKYSHDLSENDIKAFVWYNQTLGIPMTGWEKWFIKGIAAKEDTFKAIENVEFLNQQFKPIGSFQKGDTIGKVTRFKHSYLGVEYAVFRKMDGQLILLDIKKTNASQTNIAMVDPMDLYPLVKNLSLYYFNGEYIPLHIYSNSDYDILKTQLELDKEFIVTEFGPDVYDNCKCIIEYGMSCASKKAFDEIERQKMERDADYRPQTIPSRVMRIDAPLFQDRFKLNPFSEISRDTKTEVLDEDNDEGPAETISVTEAFIQYIDSLKNSEFLLISKSQFREIIISDYRQRFSKEDKEGKEKYKNTVANAQLECVRLFSNFCADVLPAETKVALNRLINLTYNRSILVNTSKIPVGFVCSSLFGLNAFRLKPVQVEAFKYAVSRNNWCLALTVGFGKTSLSIALLSYYLSSGALKKPLIVVPKPVLTNWVKEMNGYWLDPSTKTVSLTEKPDFIRHYGILTGCGYEVINLKNLDKRHRAFAPQVKAKKQCLTLCTYEALESMHIGDEDIRQFVIAEWKNILSGERNESGREWASKMLDLESKLNMIDRNAEIDIHELGFDGLFVDEAHRLKNMFTGVTADKTNRVQSSFSGTSSNRALRGFYVTMYLQKNNGRIGFLTATPFSNTPLEVYTMLCFLGYNELAKNNVNKITRFVELFFNETTEPVVGKDNRIEYKAVMKNYKNKPILNTLLSNVFLYKDDPTEAGIERPCIIRYPRSDMKLMLRMSEVQKMQRDLLVGSDESIRTVLETSDDIQLKGYAEELLDKYQTNIMRVAVRSRGGSIVASSKISALSPFAGSPVSISFSTAEPWSELYYNSPKIRFTIDAISNIIEYHKQRNETPSSILIYCEVGLNILPYFKEALENICHFKRRISIKENEDNEKDIFDEVEIIEGTASSDKEQNRRDIICKMFNMGKVKVIIGTSTIKEGLNLQENCPTLFILTPSWNSTDINQVEGRIHRQGNRYGYARVITPVVARSMDSFIFEKYDQKKARLADIWKNDGTGDTEDLNIEIKAEKQKELILDNAFEIAKIRAEMDALAKVNIYNKAKEDYDAVRIAIAKSGVYNELAQFHLNKTAEMLKTASDNLAILSSLLDFIIKDKENGIEVKTFVKRLADQRLPNMIGYYNDLIGQLSIANNTKKVVDLMNVLNTSYFQRSYNLSDNYDVKIEVIQYLVKKGFQKPDLENLFNIDIFSKIGVYTKANPNDPLWIQNRETSLQELKQLFRSSFLAEKYILQPEGLSLTSRYEDLQALVDNYALKADMFKNDLESNFEMVGTEENQKFKPRQAYLDKLIAAAQSELDEENKLARNSEELGFFFANETNPQLTYLKNDVDLRKCAIKKVASDAANGYKGDVETTVINAPVILPVAEPKKIAKVKADKKISTAALFTENIKMFLPEFQIKIIKKQMEGEEKDYFIDLLVNLDHIIEQMPKTYETDGQDENKKMVYLHYFSSGSDWYILEKDSEKDQLQAFGYVILNGDFQNAEYGYISIEELKSIGRIELDFNFTPQPLVMSLAKKGHPGFQEFKDMPLEIVASEKSVEQTEWEEAIETLSLLISIGGKKKEIAEWMDAKETLTMLLDN